MMFDKGVVGSETTNVAEVDEEGAGSSCIVRGGVGSGSLMTVKGAPKIMKPSSTGGDSTFLSCSTSYISPSCCLASPATVTVAIIVRSQKWLKITSLFPFRNWGPSRLSHTGTSD